MTAQQDDQGKLAKAINANFSEEQRKHMRTMMTGTFINPEHAAADAFWEYWRENGETHKHGYYESTWGAINAALAAGGIQTHPKEPKQPDQARPDERVEEKRAPVQGYSAGIPWAMHLRAYDAYCKMFSPQPAMIDLQGRNCRGGFHVNELDEFIPGWRDELSEITRLKARIAELEGKDQ